MINLSKLFKFQISNVYRACSFFTNLDLFCIDNARVIYRKIRYLFWSRPKFFPCFGTRVKSLKIFGLSREPFIQTKHLENFVSRCSNNVADTEICTVLHCHMLTSESYRSRPSRLSDNAQPSVAFLAVVVV